jgi:hypothetical protein
MRVDSVNRQKINTTIDCGADVNYINEKWCEDQGFKTRIQGKSQRHLFRVIKETGDDTIVLGMPWLQTENPRIDWNLRTVKIGSVVSTGQGDKMEQSTLRKDNLKTETRQKDGENLSNEESKYQQEIKETQEKQQKLPKEIKDFADVFCQSK